MRISIMYYQVTGLWTGWECEKCLRIQKKEKFIKCHNREIMTFYVGYEALIIVNVTFFL
jgi:hypothetical protein